MNEILPRKRTPSWHPGALDPAIYSFLAGGLAGASAKTATAPLDRVMLMKQLWEGPEATTNLAVIRKVWAEGQTGTAGFWKGNMLNCAKAFPQKGIVFGINDYLREMLGVPPQGGGLSIAGLLAGGISGLVATTSIYPLDVMRARKAGTIGLSNAALTAAPFAGLGPTLCGAFLKESVRFGLYHEVMSQRCWSGFDRGFYTLTGDDVHRLICPMTSGAAAGAISCTAAFPIDTVRRRIQLQGASPDEAMKHVRGLYASGGLARFYRGLSLGLIKAVPSSAVQFWVFEQLKYAWGQGDHISTPFVSRKHCSWV